MALLSEPLSALEQLLTQAGLAPHVGRPDSAAAASAQVCLWPWHLAEVPLARNAPPVQDPQGRRIAPERHVELRVLLLQGPSGSTEHLGRAFEAMLGAPVQALSQGTLRVASLPMPAETLAAVHAAAQLRMGLGAAFLLQFTLTAS
jgi:hypothetical protein